MSIVFYGMNLNIVSIKMTSQKLKIFIWNNCIFLSSKNVCFERKLFYVIECVFRRNLTTINKFVLSFTIIIFSELSSISVSLDPMFYTLNWCSSWFMRYEYSKSFYIQIIFLCLSTQKMNKIKNYICIKCIMMNQYTNFTIHPFW